MKETIDIEDLLIWAYRDQCVDRMTMGFRPQGPSASPSSGLGEFVALGVRVDNSGAAAKALGGFRLPDDALIVHDTVLGLSEWFVEWLADDSCEVWDHARAAAKGCAIRRDADGCRLVRLSKTGREADAALLEPVGLAAIIIPHARAASRPDWHEGWQETPARGRPALTVRDRRGRRRVERDDRMTTLVLRDRALYGLWHAALGGLAAELGGALQRFEPVPTGAPAAPWEAERARVLKASEAARHNSAGLKPLARKGKTGSLTA